MVRNLGWPPKSQLSHVSGTVRALVFELRLAANDKARNMMWACWQTSGMSTQHSPLEGNMTLRDPLHVEADCGNGAVRVVSDASSHGSCFGSRLDPASWLHILDRKLAALYNTISSKHEQKRYRNLRLTANTRSKDVFPAFCNPIMVTSISVDLQEQYQHASSPSPIDVAFIGACCWRGSGVWPSG